jgi:hypothetical protein
MIFEPLCLVPSENVIGNDEYAARVLLAYHWPTTSDSYGYLDLVLTSGAIEDVPIFGNKWFQ